jgi:MSHA biogenesis protein MshG
MPIFEYQGRDAAGMLLSGESVAQSADEVSVQLFKANITPTHIALKEKPALLWATLKNLLQGTRVTNNELSLFTRQMYTLAKSGVPLVFAIKHLADNSRSKYLAQILQGIVGYLESGQSLSAAMQHYAHTFSPLIIGMVRVGENSGRLDEAFLHLTDYLELEQSTVKRVKSAIRYPVFVMAAIFIGIIIINIFVIPVFSKVYMRAHIPLPAMTIILINTSNFMVKYWPYILIFLGILIGILYRYFTSSKGQFAWHKYQLKIPIVGVLLQRIILLRFAQTFAIVANSGIPIIEGLSLVGQAINNMYARQEVMLMQEAIQHGNSIIQAARACKLFTAMELQMLAVAEETGELGTMLTEIALYYQREVDYDLKRLTDMMEPLLLIAIAIMVLLLALAVYLPIWNMVKLVHH